MTFTFKYLGISSGYFPLAFKLLSLNTLYDNETTSWAMFGPCRHIDDISV